MALRAVVSGETGSQDDRSSATISCLREPPRFQMSYHWRWLLFFKTIMRRIISCTLKAYPFLRRNGRKIRLFGITSSLILPTMINF